MTDWRDEGLNVFREMLPGVLPDGVPNEKISFGDGFASELMEIGIAGIFGRLWSRPGLARRDRSLLTLGILIALGAEEEMESHFAIALHNGLTEDELAEVVYHASGYAGFPAANTAKAMAKKAFARAHTSTEG